MSPKAQPDSDTSSMMLGSPDEDLEHVKAGAGADALVDPADADESSILGLDKHGSPIFRSPQMHSFMKKPTSLLETESSQTSQQRQSHQASQGQEQGATVNQNKKKRFMGGAVAGLAAAAAAAVPDLGGLGGMLGGMLGVSSRSLARSQSGGCLLVKQGACMRCTYEYSGVRVLKCNTRTNGGMYGGMYINKQ